jgi:hypothetical protein
MPEDIYVTSHVSRDFLQNAAYFNTAAKVVWEYVSNSIDNAREGGIPKVVVEIRQDVISISDNGTGMNREDLTQFFTMHGENIQRKRGRTVRGKFGTGKTAAFGIANELGIESVKEGQYNSVVLHAEDIRSAKAGDPFPVKTLVHDESADEEDGTSVYIRRLQQIGAIDIEKTVRYVEKQLGRMRSRAQVYINEHKCEYQEPPAVNEWVFRSEGEIAERLGNVSMYIKASPTPLDREDVGIDVLSNSVWHETTLAEVTGEQVNRIFGQVDVPILDDDDQYGIPAFDNTRNGYLNRSHPVVTALLFWIQESVKKVQQELIKEAREKRKTEEAKRLRKHADSIANVLNKDFNEVLDELDELRQIVGRKRNNASQNRSGNAVLPGEGNENSDFVETAQPHGNGNRGTTPPGDGNSERPGPGLKSGKSSGYKGNIGESGNRKRSRGVFSIEFVHQTVSQKRSKYDHDSRTIYVNLDHPQIASALQQSEKSIDSPTFLDMAFEVAIVEYAQALQFERIASGESFDAGEAVYSIGEIIDRLSRIKL